MNRIHKYTVLIGVLLVVGVCFLPESLVKALPFAMKPAAFVTLFMAPALGILGTAFAIKVREWIWILPNLLLLPSFFYIMALGYTLWGA